ncbi:MAG: OsmC family protein [Flavobacteriales bacterium]
MTAARPCRLLLEWRGRHTRTYESYTREHVIRINGKAELRATADPALRGDGALHDPEDLLLAALSSCHLLTYLALCARARINVLSYRDEAEGALVLTKDGGGRFSEAVLLPHVAIEDGRRLEKAIALHAAARSYCFIANSVNFPVRHAPTVTVR